MSSDRGPDAEALRLEEDAREAQNWKRWGPYLSERQWATVREDYSPNGDLWNSFTHDQARSRAYRWGRTACSASATASAGCVCPGPLERKRSIPKERLFGLTNPRVTTRGC
jgi:hypothetical protein